MNDTEITEDGCGIDIVYNHQMRNARAGDPATAIKRPTHENENEPTKITQPHCVIHPSTKSKGLCAHSNTLRRLKFKYNVVSNNHQ